jgi:hypothetical protein
MVLSLVILIGGTVALLAGAFAGWQIWTVGPRVDRVISAATPAGRERWRARFRIFPALYIMWTCFVSGVWLLEAYSGFSLGTSQRLMPRWTGPNTTAQYFELYLGIVLVSLFVVSGVVAQGIYWFNRPRFLIPPKLREGDGMWKARRKSQAGLRL